MRLLYLVLFIGLTWSGPWFSAVGPLAQDTTSAIRDETAGPAPRTRGDAAVCASYVSTAATETDDADRLNLVARTGHTKSAAIVAVSFSPNGELALTGSNDATVILWDTRTGTQLRSLGHDGYVTSVGFSPDGRLGITGSVDGSARVWEIATGTEIKRWSINRPVVAGSFSRDGTSLLIAGGDGVCILDVGSWNPIREFHASNIKTAEFSPDGSKLIVGGGEVKPATSRTVHVWDIRTGEQTLELPVSTRSLAVSPGGLRVLVGGFEDTARLHGLTDGKELVRFEGHSKSVTTVAYAPDGKTVATGSRDGTLRIWDAISGVEQKLFRAPNNTAIESSAISPDGRLVLAGDASGHAHLWDIATGTKLTELSGWVSWVRGLGVSSDRRRLLTGGRDGVIRVWDLVDGRQIADIRAHESTVNEIIVSSGGSVFVSSGDDGVARVWDKQTLKLVREFSDDRNPVWAAATSRDDRLIVTGHYDGELVVWEVKTGRRLRTLTGHDRGILSIAFSGDDKLVLSGSRDGTARIWSVATGQTVRLFPRRSDAPKKQGRLSVSKVYFGTSPAVFSPKEQLVVMASGTVVRIWNARTTGILRDLKGHLADVVAVSFSPDGRHLLTGSKDRTVHLWEVETGQIVKTFAHHKDWVFGASFLSNSAAATASDDGTVKILDLSSRPVATFMADNKGRWLSLTDDGFFNFSDRSATEMLFVVKGLEEYDVAQMYQSLYSPDLVREALAGDPDGEVKRAAANVDLEKVISSGAVPGVALHLDGVGADARSELVAVRAEITDRGGGIGRIEWRVNGLTVGVDARAIVNRSTLTLSRSVPLDPGENAIELVAYNGRNLIASRPAAVKITYTPSGVQPKPALHVLAIGINDYRDSRFGALELAVADAKAFGNDVARAGREQYASVHVAYALDGHATLADLEKTVTELGRRIHPRDVFVLFAAAHGISKSGTFYLVPQDFRSDSDQPMEERAVSQTRLQDWIANRIRAKRAIILLDTCESGALVAGLGESGKDSTTSDAAIGRLHEAIGRPVLTATSANQIALEGYRGHGVFTYALLDALKNGDANANGLIEVSELAAHVQKLSPVLSTELRSRGAFSLDETPAGGFRQKPRLGSSGEDFAIVGRLPSHGSISPVE